MLPPLLPGWGAGMAPRPWHRPPEQRDPPASPLAQHGSDGRVTKNRCFVLFPGEEFEVVQKEVADLLKGRILVGHALHNDLKVPAPGASYVTRCPRWPRSLRDSGDAPTVSAWGSGSLHTLVGRAGRCLPPSPARWATTPLRAEPLLSGSIPGAHSSEPLGTPRVTGRPMAASTAGGRQARRVPFPCPREWGSASAP